MPTIYVSAKNKDLALQAMVETEAIYRWKGVEGRYAAHKAAVMRFDELCDTIAEARNRVTMFSAAAEVLAREGLVEAIDQEERQWDDAAEDSLPIKVRYYRILGLA